ncbi:MAG TPA: sigma-70 family RNA polymerase sigma factor [Flavitalea sp.]|nr:sigma-70 family RNA polymerase sigma factor [Flavitalea sp.]
MPGALPYDIAILLEQLSLDNEEAFRRIFDHYKAPFYETALKMTHAAGIAEEIVQEVFVMLWMKRKLAARAKNPEGYIFTILHNCIYAHFRKLAQEKRLRSAIGQIREESENPIEILLLEKEHAMILENVISQLPPQQRIIYKLAKQEGVSREEIAKRLNISPNTVRNHLAAAVAYLRAYLKKETSAIIWALIWMNL